MSKKPFGPPAYFSLSMSQVLGKESTIVTLKDWSVVTVK
jgi:hypothetical protein